MNKIRCLAINVYRSAALGDCTNRGISSRFDTLLLACPDGPITFDADAETPLNFCMLERRLGYTDIVPAAVNERGEIVPRGPYWWSCGGNIASTSDSRLSALAGHYYPIKIHDRRE